MYLIKLRRVYYYFNFVKAYKILLTYTLKIIKDTY